MIERFKQMLRDPSVPGHRVVRKVALLWALLALALVVLRHGYMGFASLEATVMTAGLAFILLFVVLVLGGMFAASLYERFLKDVGASNRAPSLATFFAEWLFAVAAPLLGVMLLGIVSSGVNWSGP